MVQHSCMNNVWLLHSVSLRNVDLPCELGATAVSASDGDLTSAILACPPVACLGIACPGDAVTSPSHSQACMHWAVISLLSATMYVTCAFFINASLQTSFQNCPSHRCGLLDTLWLREQPCLHGVPVLAWEMQCRLSITSLHATRSRC